MLNYILFYNRMQQVAKIQIHMINFVNQQWKVYALAL